MDTLRASLGEQDSLSSEKTSSSDQPIDDEKKCSGDQKRGSGCTTEAVRRECASGEGESTALEDVSRELN